VGISEATPPRLHLRRR